MTTPEAAGYSSVQLIGWGIMNPGWGAIADKASAWPHSNRCVRVCVCCVCWSVRVCVLNALFSFSFSGFTPEPLVRVPVLRR